MNIIFVIIILILMLPTELAFCYDNVIHTVHDNKDDQLLKQHIELSGFADQYDLAKNFEAERYAEFIKSIIDLPAKNDKLLSVEADINDIKNKVEKINKDILAINIEKQELFLKLIAIQPKLQDHDYMISEAEKAKKRAESDKNGQLDEIASYESRRLTEAASLESSRLAKIESIKRKQLSEIASLKSRRLAEIESIKSMRLNEVASLESRQLAKIVSRVCELPLSNEVLESLMYNTIHTKGGPFEWYFHSLGCDEDTLIKMCWEYIGKNKQECQNIIASSGNSAEIKLAQLSLNNKIAEEYYRKCLENRENDIKSTREKKENDIRLTKESSENDIRLAQESSENDIKLMLEKKENDIKLTREKREEEGKSIQKISSYITNTINNAFNYRKDNAVNNEKEHEAKKNELIDSVEQTQKAIDSKFSELKILEDYKEKLLSRQYEQEYRKRDIQHEIKVWQMTANEFLTNELFFEDIE